MQKVIQRATTARKQAQKKVYRAQQALKVVDRQQVLRQRKDYNRALITGLKESRDARWEDWEKGSLAPMRHVGPDATRYGAVDVSLMHPPAIPKHLRRKEILFAEGDRVCVIRGRDKGKINEITQINVESETVIIKDVNMVRSRPAVYGNWHRVPLTI
jgi:large subunit ribosomal protein L24